MYITEAEFLAHIKSNAEPGDPNVVAAIEAATISVDQHCGRTFALDDETSARFFTPVSQDEWWVLPIDDLGSLEDLILSTSSGGSASYSILSADDYQAEPVNGRRNGVTGWPFDAVRAVGGTHWPTRLQPWYRDTVKVEGLWGWAAVPTTVKQATKLLAALHYKLGEAALGVAGVNEFGTIRVRELPQVSTLLTPFVKSDVSFGIA